MGSIIGIYRKKLGDIVPPTKINVTNEGFESKKPHRQVSFITLEGENRLREDTIKGFCHNKFKADFVVEGLSSSDIKVQDQIKMGSAIIEITEMKKECYDICPAITSDGSCGVINGIFFGKIIQEGQVKVNDKIKHL